MDSGKKFHGVVVGALGACVRGGVLDGSQRPSDEGPYERLHKPSPWRDYSKDVDLIRY